MNGIAKVYAQALYELCREENKEQEVLGELKTLEQVFEENPAYIRLLSAPNLTKGERIAVLDEGFRGKVSEYVLNFLKILVEKGHIRHAAECFRAFGALYNMDNGILTVEAVTAVALQDAQQQKMQEKLSLITGKKVEIKNTVNAAILGGVQLRYDGKQVDDTVRGRLDSVRELLQNTML